MKLSYAAVFWMLLAALSCGSADPKNPLGSNPNIPEPAPVSGAWSGTLQPTNSQGSPVGQAVPITITIKATLPSGSLGGWNCALGSTLANISGTYQVTNSSCLTTGQIANGSLVKNPGSAAHCGTTVMNFDLVDNNGERDSANRTASLAATLDNDGAPPVYNAFSGTITQDTSCSEAPNATYSLALQKQ